MTDRLNRRRALAVVATVPAASVLGVAGLAPRAAFAQTDWPTKPIRWVNPYAAGGTSDVLARVIAQRLTERLGQPIVIESKPGAGGNVGTDMVAKATPDGYTWVVGNIGPMSVNQTMYRNLPFDPQKDLTPISLLMAYPNLIVANPANGPKSMKELLERAKADPLPYAGNGVGTSLHLTGELLARTAGIKLTHVPYRGEPPGLTDAMAGVVPLAITPIGSGLPHVKSGKLRPLAVTGATRSTLLPDVGTVAEQGVPGFDVTGWIGVLVPRATPQPIVTRIVSEFNLVMQRPDVKDFVNNEMASFVPPLGPDHFAKFIATESTKWRELVLAANLRAD